MKLQWQSEMSGVRALDMWQLDVAKVDKVSEVSTVQNTPVA